MSKINTDPTTNRNLEKFYQAKFYLFCLSLLFTLFTHAEEKQSPYIVVLGVAQDAGYPQINCYKPHCMPGWESESKRRLATSLGLVDPIKRNKYLFEATPDIKEQLYRLHELAPDNEYSLAGVFLTHAHMGHYTGLIQFGREAAGTSSVPVFTMPRMKRFLSENGPWSQLVKLNNIQLRDLKHVQPIALSKQLSIEPMLVPHRDEFSETVGFKIIGPNKTALFIPDIDKWEKWSVDITEVIKEVDYAFLDATFYSNGELPNRDMNEVPHPFVEESMKLFAKLTDEDKSKIIFIHFNHTNPLIINGSDAQKQVKLLGFQFAHEGMKISL